MKAKGFLASIKKEALRLVRYNDKLRMPPPKRNCGTCTLCCTLLRVEDVEPGVDKPRLTPCQYLAPACKGCAIYDHRPKTCQVYSCVWLEGILPPEYRPDKVGVVAHIEDPNKPGVKPIIHLYVDDPKRFQELEFNALSAWATEISRRLGDLDVAVVYEPDGPDGGTDAYMWRNLRWEAVRLFPERDEHGRPFRPPASSAVGASEAPSSSAPRTRNVLPVTR